MNNTANGGRKAYQYTKDGIAVALRFNVVNNRRTHTTYIRIWNEDGSNSGKGTLVGETYDVRLGDKAEAMKRAEKLLTDKGYTKI